MIKKIIKRIIYPMIGLSVPNQILNVYKTLLFNFLAFGFKGIIHCPIYVYNNVKICNVGKILLKCPMKRKLVMIGKSDYKSQGKTKFRNDSYGQP